MPIHHNSDGTWQWGKSGKKYRSRASAIKQMRAIFANGYRLKHDKKASFEGASRASQFLAAVASIGSYGMVKKAANKYYLSYTPRRGDGWLKLYNVQKRKNALVPKYLLFMEDAKKWNNGAVALKTGQPIRMPIYLKDMFVLPTPFKQYGKDRTKWDAIQRLNLRIADLRARIQVLSNWNANAVSSGGHAIGLAQMQQAPIDLLNKKKRAWTIKRNYLLLGRPQAALYGQRELILLYRQADPSTGRLAIDILREPLRLLYRYTRGPNAYYNHIQKLRLQGIPLGLIAKVTLKSLALKDPRVKRYMQIRAAQRALMPKRPGLKAISVSTPVTK